MYKEPHLQKQSDLCASIWKEWYYFKYDLKDEEKATKRRKLWCRCVEEFSVMVSYEVQTNPRYKDLRNDFTQYSPRHQCGGGVSNWMDECYTSYSSNFDNLMLTVANHVTAFWTVVVMNCIQPANWQYCLPVHEWLLPELVIGIEYFLDKEMNFLYSNEREFLNKLK